MFKVHCLLHFPALTFGTSSASVGVNDTLDLLAKSKCFTTLDLRSGYWQVQMEDSSCEKTALITHSGLYEFTVMPFGLCNTPATFQRLMESVLAGLVGVLAWCIWTISLSWVRPSNRTFRTCRQSSIVSEKLTCICTPRSAISLVPKWTTWVIMLPQKVSPRVLTRPKPLLTFPVLRI